MANSRSISDILDDFTYHAFGRILQGVNKKHYYTQASTQLKELIDNEIKKSRSKIGITLGNGLTFNSLDAIDELTRNINKVFYDEGWADKEKELARMGAR